MADLIKIAEEAFAGNRITSFELRELLACSKSFFSNFN